MAELELLRADHAQAVLRFELDNRAWFAESISDRGDDYFERFAEQHDAVLADQAGGVGAFYLLIDDDGAVLGRFNLRFAADGVAILGYRVAQNVAGQGVATASVRELCRLAAERHQVRIVRAATSHANVASQRVLVKTGFEPIGPADPADIGGNEGSWYELRLATQS